MANTIKNIVQVLSTTATTGGTFSFPTNVGGLHSSEKFMDVIINVKTLSSGGATFAVQEQFSDLFVQTAATGTISATGVTTLTNAINGTQASFSANALLGKGHAKQVVINVTGSPTSFEADVYAVMYNYE